MTGSKGLSAGHVFLVGLNDGHFPKQRRAITDQEVCQLLVGLSRTRKLCHVVSVGRYAGGVVRRSVFLDWLRPFLHEVKVDKAYFAA